MNQPFPLPTNGRPAEQVAGRYIPVVIGGETRRLRVLSIEHNEEWCALFEAAIAEALNGVEGVETMADVAEAVRGTMRVVVELMVAYDRDGTLGGVDYIRAHATDADIWDAFWNGVRAAAYPLGDALAKWAPDLRVILMRAMLETARSTSTKSSPRNTAGRRRKFEPS